MQAEPGTRSSAIEDKEFLARAILFYYISPWTFVEWSASNSAQTAAG
jgi:hypothetical protein